MSAIDKGVPDDDVQTHEKPDGRRTDTRARLLDEALRLLLAEGYEAATTGRIAKRAGIVLAASDFKYEVDTANGKVRAAAARIDSLQVGRIYVTDVQAVVLEDKALSKALIGMSFLSRLDRYQVENGTLVLEQ